MKSGNDPMRHPVKTSDIWKMGAFAFLLCARSGMAAAYNCAKPETEPQRTVCADPDLQRLDAKLNETFQQAIKRLNAHDKLMMQQAETGWLNSLGVTNFIPDGAWIGPNRELVKAGLTSQYVDRIKSVQCDSKYSGHQLAERLMDSLPGPSIKTPVGKYPDIWTFPLITNHLWLEHAHILADGDVGLELYDRVTHKLVFKRLFFHKPMTEEDQCVANLDYDNPQRGMRTAAPDSRLILGFSFAAQNCFPMFDQAILMLRDMPDNKIPTDAFLIQPSDILAGKQFFYLLGKPKTFETSGPTDGDCDQGPTDYQVEPQYPEFLIPLPDGSFVMYTNSNLLMPSGYLVRFDRQFNTKAPSRMLNGRLVIMDRDAFQKMVASYRSKFGGGYDAATDTAIGKALYRKLKSE